MIVNIVFYQKQVSRIRDNIYIVFLNICVSETGTSIVKMGFRVLKLKANGVIKIAQTRFCDSEFCWAATLETIFMAKNSKLFYYNFVFKC